MAGTTDIGKELKKIRIDEDERLLDMSKRIKKSSAFISAVEVGTKSPPQGFEELIIVAYNLASDIAEKLRQAADRSRKAFSLEPNSNLGRDTAGLLARKFNSLSDEDLMEIKSILDEGSK